MTFLIWLVPVSFAVLLGVVGILAYSNNKLALRKQKMQWEESCRALRKS